MLNVQLPKFGYQINNLPAQNAHNRNYQNYQMLVIDCAKPKQSDANYRVFPNPTLLAADKDGENKRWHRESCGTTKQNNVAVERIYLRG